jgi:hypothetical protein
MVEEAPLATLPMAPAYQLYRLEVMNVWVGGALKHTAPAPSRSRFGNVFPNRDRKGVGDVGPESSTERAVRWLSLTSRRKGSNLSRYFAFRLDQEDGNKMFNSSVLDVAIGLVFVYLVLGLMCTTVNEWLAQLFKTRAATLREGIRRLLHAPPDGTYLIRPVDINVAALAKRLKKPDDKLTQAVGPFSADLQSALAQFETALAASPDAQPPGTLASAMADQLNAVLDQPGLGKKIDDSKVTPETRAEAAKILKEKDLLRVNRALLNEAFPDVITSLSDSFYSHPLIKSLARPGEHPAYVPSKTFALTLMDILAKGQAAAGTAEQRTAQIKAAIDNLPDSDVKKSLQALLVNGSDSVEQVQQKLEGWFDASMDRVSGWYKNRVQVWTVVVASVVTILINADTIQIAQKLMINPALRDEIVQEAKNEHASNTDPSAPTLTAQQKDDLSGLTGWASEFRIFHHIDACSDASLRGGQLTEADCRSESEEKIKTNGNSKFVATWNSDTFPGTRLLSMVAFPWLWTVVPTHIAGWILTAIAASLGAPFWFDILNRFMNVRAAGTSPTEKGSDRSKS